jgi:hypothetical protein
VWCWRGNTGDSALIRQARTDMRDWTLARVMWVADRGFSSRENPRELRRGGGHYIIGEKLRSGSAEAAAALSRQGRYQHVRDNLQVKVRIVADERFVICFNPEQAERDAALREVMLDKLTAMITGTDTLSVTKRAELRGRISTMPELTRFLRTPAGCSASTARRSPPRGTWTGSTCCAARTRTSRPRTSRWATSSYSMSNAAGET